MGGVVAGGDHFTLPPVMVSAEVAQLLRISVKTLANWRSMGQGPPFIKVGGRVAYRAQAVLDWARQQEIEGRGGEGLSKVKITTRPYKKDPSRLHVDIVFPNPHIPDKDIRRRLVAPHGMDSSAAEAWGMLRVREILREFGKSTVKEEKEETTQTAPTKKLPPPAPMIPTLRQFWPRFVEEYAEPSLKQGSRDSYETAWRHHIEPLLGDLPLDRVDLAAIARLTRSSRVKGHIASYRNLLCGKLLVMLRKAADLGIIPRDAIPQIPWERVKQRPKDVYTTAQVECVVQTARAKSDEDHVLLLLLSKAALRIGEATGLMWDDIDWERGTLTIQRNVFKGLLQDSPKGEIGAVPIAPILKAALLQLREGKGPRGPFVIPRLRSGRWTHCNDNTLATRVSALQRAAGVAPKGPHMHRHTALTLAARAGVPPLALQKLARHSRLDTTMRYYVHIQDVEMAALAVAALDPAPTPRVGNGLAT